MVLAICGLVLIGPGCLTGDDGPENGRPRNIILMIGDGMGLSHISAGRIARGGLNIERMKTVGLQSTVPAEGTVTDSAASGTAMATGYKTLNGAISMDPEGVVLETVLEYAEKKGMMTGLVATCSITHATPAAFASHVPDRGMSGEIAWQISHSGVDLLIGGGLEWFLPRSEEGSMREDSRDPLSALGERMPVVRPGETLEVEDTVKALAVFTAMGHPPALPMREPGLVRMTRQALDVLSAGDSGFFLMIEGSQIDWAAHDNDLETMLMEIAEFDSAVGVVLDFASAEG
ncbi:MAG TPA: alkaline phosphatase, partial [Candidatus Krumholzibacterium sp.]|nr:alkaline phosphatase [Candidatus Krumholzibacterium sp.]